MNGAVYAITLYMVGAAAQVVAGGNFTTAGSEVSAYWARFGPICAPGDVDGDGTVGILDFLALLAAWGLCPPEPCPADFDGDGGVGITDFLALLANWS